MGRALVHEMYLRVKNALMNVLLITEGWSSVFRMMCLTLSSTQFPSRWTSSDWWHACSSPHQTQWVPDACVNATFHNNTIDFNSLILSLPRYFTHSQVWVTIESTYYSSHKTHLHHYLFESVPFLLIRVPNRISIVYLMLLFVDFGSSQPAGCHFSMYQHHVLYSVISIGSYLCLAKSAKEIKKIRS